MIGAKGHHFISHFQRANCSIFFIPFLAIWFFGCGHISNRNPSQVEQVATKSEVGIRSTLPQWDYSDLEWNQQIVPYSPNGMKARLDQLIYPTIAQPKLLSKLELESTPLVVALRSRGLPRIMAESGKLAAFQKMVRIYLMPRSARRWLQVTRPLQSVKEAKFIKPIQVSDVNWEDSSQPNLRRTYFFTLSAEDLKTVSEGLYDLRVEWVERNEEYDFDKSPYFMQETQYNAVQIWEQPPTEGSVKFVILGGSRVGGIRAMEQSCLEKLSEFVEFMNISMQRGAKNLDPIRSASFIVMSGNLLDSPSLRAEEIQPTTEAFAYSYSNQFEKVENLLKELPLPLVLVPGEGDAEARVDWFSGRDQRPLDDIIRVARPIPWIGFNFTDFKRFMREGVTKEKVENNWIYGSRDSEDAITGNRIALNRANTNYILFDGLSHWRKRWGSLHSQFNWQGIQFFSVSSADQPLAHRLTHRTNLNKKSSNLESAQQATQLTQLLRPSVKQWLRKASNYSDQENTSSTIVFSDRDWDVGTYLKGRPLIRFFTQTEKQGEKAPSKESPSQVPLQAPSLKSTEISDRSIASSPKQINEVKVEVPDLIGTKSGRAGFWVVEVDKSGVRQIQRFIQSGMKDFGSTLDHYQFDSVFEVTSKE